MAPEQNHNKKKKVKGRRTPNRKKKKKQDHGPAIVDGDTISTNASGTTITRNDRGGGQENETVNVGSRDNEEQPQQQHIYDAPSYNSDDDNDSSDGVEDDVDDEDEDGGIEQEHGDSNYNDNDDDYSEYTGITEIPGAHRINGDGHVIATHVEDVDLGTVIVGDNNTTVEDSSSSTSRDARLIRDPIQQRIQDLERQAYELAVLQQNTIEAVRVDDDTNNGNGSNNDAVGQNAQNGDEEQQQDTGIVPKDEVEVIQAGNIQTVAEIRKQKRQRLLLTIAVVLVIIVVATIVANVAASARNGSDNNSNNLSGNATQQQLLPPTTSPTDAPTTTSMGRLDYIMSVLNDNLEYDFIVQIENNPTLLQNINTPQGQAFYWLTEIDNSTIINNDIDDGDEKELYDYINIIQRYSLAVYYYANINFWFEDEDFRNWTKPGVSVCYWFGVDCKGGSPITTSPINDINETNIMSNMTNDTSSLLVPDDSETVVRVLTDTSFDLAGEIQSEFRLLTTLEHLKLWNGALTGTIPHEIAELTRLTYLSFGTNYLTGKIPPALSSLSMLTFLSFARNLLTGTIPDRLFDNMSNLKVLQLSTNLLSGPIPSSLEILPSLSQIGLQNNTLTGDLNYLFCDANLARFMIISADCRGDNPEVLCDCCLPCY